MRQLCDDGARESTAQEALLGDVVGWQSMPVTCFEEGEAVPLFGLSRPVEPKCQRKPSFADMPESLAKDDVVPRHGHSLLEMKAAYRLSDESAVGSHRRANVDAGLSHMCAENCTIYSH